VKSSLPIKVAVSAAAVLLIALRASQPSLLPADAVTVGLLIAVVLPWLGSLLDTAEFPGGWKLKFRELKIEQEKQRDEIEGLRFLMTSFVTDDELGHLTKLASGSPFPYHKSDPFIAELRRLRSLGLIANQPEKGIAGMPSAGDLREIFAITARGRTYLQMREQWKGAAEAGSPGMSENPAEPAR
jgi:hypothetical protein